MIEVDDARRIAEEFIQSAPSAFRYEFVDTRMVRGEWSVVLAVFTLEGNELDGPVVVRVAPATGIPRFLRETG